MATFPSPFRESLVISLTCEEIPGDDFFASGLSGSDLSKIQESIRFTLIEHGLEEGELSVELVSDDRMLGLNSQFRGVRETTDVLTFPPSILSADIRPAPLGDLAICVPCALRQAQARGVTLIDELCMLGIHGALHLIGFDDLEEPDQRMMQKEMARIAGRLSLPCEEEWFSLYPEEVH